MANLAEIERAQQVIANEVSDRINKDPNVGVNEFVAAGYKVASHSVQEPSNEELRKVTTSLPVGKQIVVRREIDDYQKDKFEMREKLAKGDKSSIKDFAMKTIKRLPGLSAALGAGYGIAQWVNIVAPNLYPTLVGFFTGVSEMSAWEKFLMVIGSAITPEPVSKGVILATGAAIGGVIYGVGAGAKAIYRKIKKNNNKENRKERRITR